MDRSVTAIVYSQAQVDAAVEIVAAVRTRARVGMPLSDFCYVSPTEVWLPLPPTATAFPPAAITVNTSPKPENTIPVPPDFDETDLCALFQDILPSEEIPAVYAEEIDFNSLLKPYNEFVSLDGATRQRLEVRDWPYVLVLPTAQIDAVVRSQIIFVLYTLGASAGALALSGQAAGFLRDRNLSAAIGSFVFSGQAAGFIRLRKISGDAGTFALGGQNATLAYQRLPLTAEAGGLNLTGQDVNFFRGKSVIAEAGSFVLSGQDAGFTRPQRVVAADAGSINLTGQDAALTFTPVAAQASVLTYTGNATNRSITGSGFKPGFVYIAPSAVSSNAQGVFDYARGATKGWEYNVASAQYTIATTLTSFDSDGFSIGTNSVVNTSSRAYVAFLIKEGATAASNTNGTITSTTYVNSTAGFSIFEYTGNGTNDATVGHGLSATPGLVIIKNTVTTGAVALVGSSDIGANVRISTNSTSSTSDTTSFRGFGSSTLTLGTNTGLNASGRTYTGYAFTDTSTTATGTYTGNNTGTITVTLGFRPTVLFLKSYGATTSGHLFHYRTASGDGFASFVDGSNNVAPGTSTTVSITSTGFTVAAGGVGNSASGTTAVYLAIR